jgi:hypothetical protein
VRARCREIARERFDRPLGVEAYRTLYADILHVTAEPAT